MKLGSKSILLGAHQFIWHPIAVYRAWCFLYRKRPNLMETFCIVVHDLGYWGASDLDGPQGKVHPILGAKIAGYFFGWEAYDLCAGHSRSYAKMTGREPSKLCYPDKLAPAFDPWWFYIPRCMLTGEIKEYRKHADACGFIPELAPHRAWYRKLIEHEKRKAIERAHQQLDLAIGNVPRRAIH